MASLTGSTIAESYEQLLSLPDGGLNGNNLVAITDGDSSTAIGMKVATNKIEIIPGSNDANAFEVSQADGTAVLTVNTSTVGATLIGTLTVGVNDTGHDVKFFGATATNGYMLWDESTDDLILGSASKIGIGTTSPTGSLSIAGASGVASNVYLDNHAGDADSANVIFRKSRNATVGSHTSIANNDNLGLILFQGSDGNSYETGASIGAEVDSTPGDGDMPGRLVFKTTSDGASSATERMRISRTGAVTIGEIADEGDAIITNGADGGRYDVLTVQEATNERWNLSFEGSGSTNSLTFNSNSTSNVLILDNATGNATFAGNVNCNANFTSHGVSRLGGSSESSFTVLDGDNASGAFRFSSGDTNENVHIEYYEGDIGSIAFSEQIDTGGSQVWNKYNAAGDVIQTVNQAGLVVLQQGANDGSILEFRSSDVAHGMTDQYPTDTYGAFNKSSNNDGGLRAEGYSEAKIGIQLDGISTTDNTTKSTSGAGNVSIRAWKKSSNSWDTIESDGNLLTVGNGNAVRFIFDEDGDFHYDSSAVAYDSYNDAQLVRAFDSTMSPKNIIQSKWDEFVTYKEKDLVEANLLGKVSDEEKAEGVRPLVNLTGMSRLHNGAIWQQYTEMQKMKELMYDAMVELMGKEKADKKLKNHDVSLLDNKDLLN